jgi:hypothetical protein
VRESEQATTLSVATVLASRTHSVALAVFPRAAYGPVGQRRNPPNARPAVSATRHQDTLWGFLAPIFSGRFSCSSVKGAYTCVQGRNVFYHRPV